ncbi:MAG: hypothetical protein QOG16_828 [Actinomycetota bacterium]|jgi:hypothetical protein|nr:hypothetical protein [Actinomycetota bacterium]
MRSIGGLIYLIIGLLMAWKKHYFGNINGIGEFINLLLAILLWPLVLFGVKFNLHFGGGKDNNALSRAAGLFFGPPVAYARAKLSSVLASR